MHDANVRSGLRWWGEYRLDVDTLGYWQVGPLVLWVRRTALDWRYAVGSSDDPLGSSLEIRVPCPPEPGRPDETARIGLTKTGDVIELVPALADRAIVARPAVPFWVPPKQRVELYVSTPLWVRMKADGSGLGEVPCLRPSDTWFGANTQGLLCYASRTHLRRSLANVELRPHRATSHLTVENRAKQNLSLERICLPVPQLSLFAGPSGALWTEHVSVRNDEDGDLSEVRLGQGPPREAGEAAELVAEARAPRGRSFGSLVFGGLFESGL